MIIFNTDLDNTIIYSYKHNIGDYKKNVEKYNGRDISFITNKTYNLLLELCNKIMIVPTTTRTIEQYNRIDLGIGPFKYALVCNGGVLLEDGIINKKWYDETKALIAGSQVEMDIGKKLLENEQNRYFEVRYIEDMFLFTKCKNPLETVEGLKQKLNLSKVKIYNNGDKVYILPVGLSKGDALRRFRAYVNPTQIIAAGDSEFDISMLEEADYGIAPFGFCKAYSVYKEKVHEMAEYGIFSDILLSKCLKIARLYT